MKKIVLSTLLIVQTALVSPVFALEEEPVLEQPNAADAMVYQQQQAKVVKSAPPAALTVRVGSIANGMPIATKFAYCAPDGAGATREGGNISPGISWSGAPAATKSYTLLVVDTDVPVSFELANKPGKEIDLTFPRKNFYHWVLADIPRSLNGLLEGKSGNGVMPGGKATGNVGYGINGRNDYATLYKGTYGGYDGPCPPWNDLRLHHYHFTVYALDITTLNLPSPLTGAQALSAMDGHILARGEVVGTYSTNVRWLPELKAKLEEQQAIEQEQNKKKSREDQLKLKLLDQSIERNANRQAPTDSVKNTAPTEAREMIDKPTRPAPGMPVTLPASDQ